MTEDKIKEMLKDIIDNGAEYEGCSLCGECNYKRENCDATCTLTSRLWDKYHLGDEIRSDWEYRKVEKWYVYLESDGSYISLKKRRIGKTIFDKIMFEGTKEECEQWIGEHTKKTWLEENYPLNDYYTYLYINISLNESKRESVKEICKKILEEMDKTTKERHIRDENFPFYFRKRDIEQIILHLGVEV